MKNSTKPSAKADTKELKVKETPATNVVTLTPLDMLNEAAFVSKGVSVDLIRYTAQYANRLAKSEEGKKNNTFSIGALKEADKIWLKEHCCRIYLNYTGEFNHAFIKKMKYTSTTYNLKLIVEKFEAYLEEIFIQAGVIDAKGNILQPDMYNEWYNKCRIYTHEQAFADQFANGGKIDTMSKWYPNYKGSYIDTMKANYPVTTDGKMHKRLTTKMIQDRYEAALGIKFAENIYSSETFA